MKALSGLAITLIAFRLIPNLFAQTETAMAGNPEQDIRAVLQSQVAAWNRGDLAAFMNGYARSETTAFVSGDQVTGGWQTVMDRYKKRYPDRASMGTLTFTDLAIEVFSADAAVAKGRWELKRAGDHPHGRFTLILSRLPERWRIVYDHTSAAEK